MERDKPSHCVAFITVFWLPESPSFLPVIWGSHFSVIHSCIHNTKTADFMLQKIRCWALFSFRFLYFDHVWCGTLLGKSCINFSRIHQNSTALCVWFPRHIFDSWGDLIVFDGALRLIRLQTVVLFSCCAQQCLLEGWGEGCLLSCYRVYVIHYLLTASSATYKSSRYLGGIIIMCTFNLSI